MLSASVRQQPPVRGGGLNACRALRMDGGSTASHPYGHRVETDREAEELARALAASARAQELQQAEEEAMQEAIRRSTESEHPTEHADAANPVEQEALEIALALSAAEAGRAVTPPPPARAAWASADASQAPEPADGAAEPTAHESDDGVVIEEDACASDAADDPVTDVRAIEAEDEDASGGGSDSDWVLC